MLRKIGLLLSAIVLAGSVDLWAADENGPDKRSGFADLIEKPVRAILRPVGEEGLADLVSRPLNEVLGTIDDLGEKTLITPGKTNEYIYNVNKNASVIDREDIDEMNPKDLQQILSYQQGIMINGYFGNAKDSQLDMRGFGETGPMNYVLLIDGRRTNQIDLSGPDLSQIDVKSIERIEILRGANSVLYGDNATGGVINIITRKGRKGDRIEYSQEFGSYQYNKEYFSVEGGHDFLDYFFNYSYQNSDGYRLNNDYEANDIFSSFTAKPADSLNICFSSGYHRDWYGQPGALYAGNIQTDGRRGSRYPDSKAKTEDYYFEVDPRVSGDAWGSQWLVSAPVSYRARRADALSVGFNRYETDHHIKTLDFRPKCEFDSPFFGGQLENKLVFGADCFSSIDRVLNGDITFNKAQLDITKSTFGIYASDNALIAKRFLASCGVRGEWAKYVFSQFQPAGFYDTQELREAAFDAGIGYKYNERSQIYANFARSYRFPATDEFFQSAYESFDWWTGAIMVYPAILNSGLKQQVGNNCEIGVKDNSFGFVDANAAYYFIDNRDEIYFDPLTFQNENYPHVVHHGLELGAGANASDKVRPFCKYTFEKSFFVGGTYASKTLPLVPENKLTVGTNIKPIKPLSLDMAINFAGARYAASDDTNGAPKLKSYTTVDLGINYEIKNLRAFFRINNVLNEAYFSNGTKNWLGNVAFYPAPELNMQGGVSVSF